MDPQIAQLKYEFKMCIYLNFVVISVICLADSILVHWVHYNGYIPSLFRSLFITMAYAQIIRDVYNYTRRLDNGEHRE